MVKETPCLQTKRMNLWLLGGQQPLMEGRDSQGAGDGHVHTAVFKWVTNKCPLYSTWNSLKIMWQPGWEGGSGENGCMYMDG